MIKLSVTIATYNRYFLLEKVLSSLANQTLGASLYEIIVCDSHSSDATAEVLNDFTEKFPSIKIVHAHTKNVLSAKRNLGIDRAKGEVVIFLDDDCIPEKGFLEKYYAYFYDIYSNEKHLILCGEVRFPEDWVKSSNYYRFRDSRHFGRDVSDHVLQLDFKTIVVMNMAFRKSEFIDKIGKVNEGFKGYGCEDQDLGWRLEESGFIIRACKSKIWHYELSGDIEGYSRKMYHTARDGVTNLIKLNSPAFLSIRPLSYMDSRYPVKSSFKALLFSSFRVLVFNDFLARFFSRFLKITDKNNFFYIPLFYRYVLGYAYLRGVKDSKNKKVVDDDWYG